MQQQNTQPVAVSTQTAAVMLDTTPAMILYRINRGELPARKLGKTWRIAVKDINALVGVAVPS